MYRGIFTTIIILADKPGAQYQLHTISRKLATSSKNFVLRL